MTMQPSDVLAVELLQKEARIASPQRVVPLFETMRALEDAGTHRGGPAGDSVVPRSAAADGRK